MTGPAVRIAQRAEQERPRVLIVDDDGVVLALLRDTLSRQFDVVTAESGPVAMEALAAQEFAVLLADQRMPGMTGVQLASHARQANPDVVTILLSAYTDPQAMIAAINEGQVFRFLQKPWDANDLILTLHQAAERYRLSRDNARLLNELERRLRGLEVLQEVATAVAAGSVDHPASVLMERLADVVLYDLAAVMLVPERGAPATLELRGRRAVSEKNAIELWEQMLEIYQYFAGAQLPEERVRPRIAVEIDPRLESQEVRSQVQVPLRLDDRVAGVLTVQSFKSDAYPKDVARLLDLLANGTADAVARVQQVSHRKWRLLEQIWRDAPDGMVLCSATGQVQRANQAAQRLFADRDLGSTLWRVLGMTPDEVMHARTTPLDRIVQLGERAVAAKLWPVHDDGALDVGLVVTLRDISDLQAYEGERRAFFSTMSHEIRTPLVSVSAAVDLLLDGDVGDLNERQRRYVSHADKACRALNQLIDDLLDLEKFSQNKVELNPEPTDFVALCQEVTARYEAAAEESELRLEIEASGEYRSAPVDSRRAEQVVGNLLSNAIRHGARGSVIRVSVASSATMPDWLVVGVHNQGSSIAPDELELIFERFRQGRSSHGGQRRGSGLGLAISRGIVESHGGALLAASGEAGTSFWAAWPRALTGERGKVTTRGNVLWVAAPDDAIDGVVVAAQLVRRGMRARLLPADEASARAAREASSGGLTIALGHAVDVDGAQIVCPIGGRPGITELVGALTTLTRRHPQALAVEPVPTREVTLVLEALGLKLGGADVGALGLALVGAEHATPAEFIVQLAAQLAAGAERKAPVCAFVRERRRSGGVEAFGAVRIEHLAPYRAAYGAAREGLLRQALHDLLERVLRQRAPRDGIAWMGFESGALFAGTRDLVDAVLAELAQAFPAIGRLHYRKQDREQGYLEVAGERAPLVALALQPIAAAEPETTVLEALGLEAPCVWLKS